MTPQLVEFLRHVGQLKALDRRGWKLRSIPKPETVAGHMHRMSIIALATLDPSLTRDLDMNKVIQMCILHDMAECIVGDITPHDNVPEHEKHKQEMAAMQKLCKFLLPVNGDRLMSLFVEYEKRQSPESKLTKEIDIYDMMLQAFEYEISEHERTGKVPDFSSFFRGDLVTKVCHPAMQPLLNDLLQKRKAFLDMHQGLVVERELISLSDPPQPAPLISIVPPHSLQPIQHVRSGDIPSPKAIVANGTY